MAAENIFLLKKIAVYLRPIKYLILFFFHSPKLLFKKLKSDLGKDICNKKLKKNFHLVWCVGLPKSGTTLIEEILAELPLVQGNNSFFRLYDNSDLDHIHGISNNMFRKFPKNKLTFIKTHTHFEKHYIDIATNYKAKIIVSLRDIRDVMISRYHHILADSNHWQHNKIKDLQFKEGFIKSFKEKHPSFESSLTYFYKWILNWKNYIKNNNNCLVLWYEDFAKDPKFYIRKITDYLKIDDISVDKIYLNLKINEQVYQKQSLRKNLGLIEKKTFRKGTSGEWKNILDEETLKTFYSSLPDDISKIENKT